MTKKRRPRGTVYTIDLDQATVDALERGVCPEALAQTAHDLLRWRREAIRATTPERPIARRRAAHAHPGRH